MFDAKVNAPHLRVPEIGRNGTYATERTGELRSKGCKNRRARQSGESGLYGGKLCGSNSWRRRTGEINGDSIQRSAIKVERVQHYVVEGQHGCFSKGQAEQGFVPGRESKAQTRLPVIFVRRARGNKTVALETGAVWPLDLSTLECSRLKVIAYTSVHGQLPGDLPGVLDVEAVNVVLGSYFAWTKRDRQTGWRKGSACTTGRLLPKVELREERVPGIVADIETGLPGVVAVGPGKVVDVLIALLQTALRATEISAGWRAAQICVDNSGGGRGVRGRADEAEKDKPSFIRESGRERR